MLHKWRSLQYWFFRNLSKRMSVLSGLTKSKQKVPARCLYNATIKTLDYTTFHITYWSNAGRWNNLGMHAVKGGHNLPLLVGIRLTDLSNIGGIRLWQYWLWSFQGKDSKLERFFCYKSTSSELVKCNHWILWIGVIEV